MPEQKKTFNSQKTNKNGSFNGFFNPTITSEIKAAVNAMALYEEAFNTYLCELVQMGFKISIREDKSGTHFTVTAFDLREDSDSKGYVLSVKHSGINTAVGLIWYLIVEVYNKDGWMPWIGGEVDLDW